MPDDEIVIYKRGEIAPTIPKRIPPELLQIIMLDDLRVAMGEVNKHLEKEEFEGKEDPRTLSATDQLQWIDLIDRYPNTPWATAFFFNDGPNRVYITINDVYPTVPLNRGESDRKDFTKADKRIGLIYYWCDAGNTASVRARGKY